MKNKRAIAAISVTLCLAPFTPGCSSFRHADGFHGARQAWSWLKSTTADKAEIERFTSNIRPQPGNPLSHCHLGAHYLRSGRYEDAIQEFEKAIRIKPDYMEAFNLLAVSYDRLGLFGGSEKAYQAAIRINPEIAYIHNNLGHSFIQQGRWQEALESLKKAAQLDKGKPSARIHNNLGMAYVMTGRYQDGMAAFEQAGGKAEAHYNMARAYAYKGLMSEAHKEHETAVRLNPASDLYRKGLAECRQQAEALRFAREITQAVSPARTDSGRAVESAPETPAHAVGIEISNGNGIASFARRIGRFLKERGFTVVRLTNADTFDYEETKIYYKKGYDAASAALAKEMPAIPEMEEVKRFDRPRIKVKMVLGKDLASYKEAFTEDGK